MFDKDGSGIISADEIKTVLGFGDSGQHPSVIENIIK